MGAILVSITDSTGMGSSQIKATLASKRRALFKWAREDGSKIGVSHGLNGAAPGQIARY